MSDYVIHCGDCLEVLPTLPSASVESVVCDPPYELNFMSKNWDRSGIAYNVNVWRECLRILKPGGHLLAFGGSRTYHRLACAVEDAGFEIRDQIQWIYGSGFPKSLDVSKAIDEAAEVGEVKVYGEGTTVRLSGTAVSGYSGGLNSEPIGLRKASQPSTEEAKQWDGWGTALKPAHEPIVLARKPLIGTVAENILQHGTGGLNIDGCRIETSETISATRNYLPGALEPGGTLKDGERIFTEYQQHQAGRWPSNIIHDGSDEVLALLPHGESDNQS